MGIRAVVVDIGGVLEHTEPTGWVEKWEARLGLQKGGLRPLVSPIWRPGRVGEASLSEIEQQTAAVLRLDKRQSDELWADVWTAYVGTLNRRLLDYLSGLRPRCRTAILSNSFVGAREREQALYGFEEHFDHVIYSHEEGLEKPHPRLYTLTCERLGVAPDEVVFVDDLPANIEGARALGMETILFEDTARTIRLLEKVLGR
jgi:epoxide hydrolase-like predicted phosphatase